MAERNENEIVGAELELEQPHEGALTGDGGEQEVPSELPVEPVNVLLGVSNLSVRNESFVVYLLCHDIAIGVIGDLLYRKRLEEATTEESAQVIADGTTWTTAEARKVTIHLNNTPPVKRELIRIAGQTAENANTTPIFARMLERAHITLLLYITPKEAAKHRNILKKRKYRHGRDDPEKLLRKTKSPDFKEALEFEMRLQEDFLRRFQYTRGDKHWLRYFLHVRLEHIMKKSV